MRATLHLQTVVRYAVSLSPGTSDVTVTAQLYYQAIPPYFVHQRFEQALLGFVT